MPSTSFTAVTPTPMLGLEQALASYREHLRPGRARTLRLEDALGQVLARDLRSTLDLPPLDQSAMDGYAVAADTISSAGPDAEIALPIAFTIPAGTSPIRLPEGQCARIMTGAALPPGADSVVIQEQVKRENDYAIFGSAIRPGRNVRRQGEELTRGARLLARGTRLKPQQLALAANAGHAYLPCFPAPRCEILVTGDELVPPGAARSGAQIYESNGVFLQNFLHEERLRCAPVRHCGDDLDRLTEALGDALGRADLVLITGGASVGEFDFSRAAARRCGVNEVFWKVRQKPGKPLSFGLGPQGQAVLILPGNPGSIFVCAQVHLRAVLHAMRGQAEPQMITAALQSTLNADPQRDRLVRMRCKLTAEGLQLDMLPRQASHMISNLAETQAIVHVPAGHDLQAGAPVRAWIDALS